MTVKVLFFAQLRDLFGASQRLVSASDGATIDDILRALERASRGRFPGDLRLVYAVNEEFRDGLTVLRDEDVLALMTPMAGG